MRKIPGENLTVNGKSNKNKTSTRGKMFGYQVLGFGAGGPSFVGMTATGGTITTDGKFQIHTFTGNGTFCVSALSPDPAANVVDYVIVGGGGAGVHGGGGAGGFRESPGSSTCYTASPLGQSPAAAIPISVQGYPIVVGAAGGPPLSGTVGDNGSPSSGFSLTSAGGGGGGGRDENGAPGGSGGGAGDFSGSSGGFGNQPSVDPPQGTDGGAGGSPTENGGGGGGATAAGTGAPGGGTAGVGATSGITGSSVVYAQGGRGDGGTAWSAPQANKGFGGNSSCGSTGGGTNGVVIIRFKVS